jgi:hypothetical protein
VAAHRRRRAEERDEERRAWTGLSAEQSDVLDAALDETCLVASVAYGARENWRAAAWLLERQYPARWASRPREPEAPAPNPQDPFAEVDELAARRRRQRDR